MHWILERIKEDLAWESRKGGDEGEVKMMQNIVAVDLPPQSTTPQEKVKLWENVIRGELVDTQSVALEVKQGLLDCKKPFTRHLSSLANVQQMATPKKQLLIPVTNSSTIGAAVMGGPHQYSN